MPGVTQQRPALGSRPAKIVIAVRALFLVRNDTIFKAC